MVRLYMTACGKTAKKNKKARQNRLAGLSFQFWQDNSVVALLPSRMLVLTEHENVQRLVRASIRRPISQQISPGLQLQNRQMLFEPFLARICKRWYQVCLRNRKQIRGDDSP